MKLCPQCNEKEADDSVYCSECGSRFSKTKDDFSQPENPPTPNNAIPSFIVFLIICDALAAIGAVTQGLRGHWFSWMSVAYSIACIYGLCRMREWVRLLILLRTWAGLTACSLFLL